MNHRLYPDIISTNISVVVLALDKMDNPNFMMWSLSSMLFFFFVSEGGLSDRPLLEFFPVAV